MERIMRIVVGLGLIGYGIYSGNSWFYLGIIPLVTGLINWCPMKSMMGGCKDGECSTGSCGTSKSEEKTSCCSVGNETEKTSCCSTEANSNSKETCCASPDEQIKQFQEQSSTMNFSTNKNIIIKILGTGCANCIALKKVVDEAVLQLDEDIEVLKVEDLQEIMSYNVVSMPGFVINEKVITTGKVLSIQEVKEYIEKEQK